MKSPRKLAINLSRRSDGSIGFGMNGHDWQTVSDSLSPEAREAVRDMQREHSCSTMAVFLHWPEMFPEWAAKQMYDALAKMEGADEE